MNVIPSVISPEIKAEAKKLKKEGYNTAEKYRNSKWQTEFDKFSLEERLQVTEMVARNKELIRYDTTFSVHDFYRFPQTIALLGSFYHVINDTRIPFEFIYRYFLGNINASLGAPYGDAGGYNRYATFNNCNYHYCQVLIKKNSDDSYSVVASVFFKQYEIERIKTQINSDINNVLLFDDFRMLSLNPDKWLDNWICEGIQLIGTGSRKDSDYLLFPINGLVTPRLSSGKMHSMIPVHAQEKDLIIEFVYLTRGKPFTIIIGEELSIVMNVSGSQYGDHTYTITYKGITEQLTDNKASDRVFRVFNSIRIDGHDLLINNVRAKKIPIAYDYKKSKLEFVFQDGISLLQVIVNEINTPIEILQKREIEVDDELFALSVQSLNYKQYLDKRPNGRHREEVEKLLANQLQTKLDMQRADNERKMAEQRAKDESERLSREKKAAQHAISEGYNACISFISNYPTSPFINDVKAEVQRLDEIKANQDIRIWKLGDRLCHELNGNIICGTLEKWNEDKSKVQIKIVTGPGGFYEGESVTKNNLMWISTSGKGWHICLQSEIDHSLANDNSIEKKEPIIIQKTDDNYCRECGGKGVIICSNCNGTGSVQGFFDSYPSTCDRCKGKGSYRCSSCGGKGRR